MVSLTGILIGTMALITVLSVFNGFEKVIKSLYHSFDPDLLITPITGKTFDYATFPANKIKKLNGVQAVVKVVEEDALFKYGNKQYIAKIKGISENYEKISRLDTMMIDGNFQLQEGKSNYAILGAGVAWILGVNLRDVAKMLVVYVPKRGNPSTFSFVNAFNMLAIHPAGVFSIQQDFDEKYVLAPLRFVRKLLNYNTQLTSLEIYLKKGVNDKTVQKNIASILGKNFSVNNRFEQNKTLFKVMESEKVAIFLILVFILILASFNMIGSVSILIVEKMKDIAILKSMGADKNQVRTIFLTEGLLINFIGASLGLLFGFIILFLQQHYGFLKLGGNQGDFIINAYPVNMKVGDFILVFCTVQIIGLIASWYPVKYLLRNFEKISL